MSDQSRDWDKELADIDKVIEGGPGDPGVAPARRAPGVAPAAAPPSGRGSVALTWFWVILAAALAVALPLWPYERHCGLQLGFFLGATGLTLLAGFLGAMASWANRRGFGHIVSLVVIVWAGSIAAREVLPRIGYARESRTWLCPDTPPQPAPAPQAAPGSTPTPTPAPAPAPAAP
jgi:hypothetical protein